MFKIMYRMGVIRFLALLIILWGLSWYAGGPDGLEKALWVTGVFVVIPVALGFLIGYFELGEEKTTTEELRLRAEVERSETTGRKVLSLGVIALIGFGIAAYFRFR